MVASCSVLDDDHRALARLQEHACHSLLDEHDQAFIASRVLSSISRCPTESSRDSYRSAASALTVHARNVLVRAANTETQTQRQVL
jgi:hypothetical protein